MTLQAIEVIVFQKATFLNTVLIIEGIESIKVTHAIGCRQIIVTSQTKG